MHPGTSRAGRTSDIAAYLPACKILMKYVSSTRIPIALRSVKLQKVVCGANFQMVIRRSDAPESQIRAKDQNTVSHHPLEREGVLFVEAQDAIQRLDADVVPVEALKIGY